MTSQTLDNLYQQLKN